MRKLIDLWNGTPVWTRPIVGLFLIPVLTACAPILGVVFIGAVVWAAVDDAINGIGD